MSYTIQMKRNRGIEGWWRAIGFTLMIFTLALGIAAVMASDRQPGISATADHGPIAGAVAPWADDGMVANGTGCPAEPAFFTVPAVVGAFGIDTNRPGSEAVTHFSSDQSGPKAFTPRTTTASISAKKAMEFTLIGAKPSGTS
ncbi:hypothetical protein TRIP_C20123 [Candidatus Zixiibacteriota bacterium]|nr:hypothetical protein TRIP_C20123 [candidate division Zixibacteria bacterium]